MTRALMMKDDTHDSTNAQNIDDEERRNEQHDLKLLRSFKDEEERNAKFHCITAMTMAKEPVPLIFATSMLSMHNHA